MKELKLATDALAKEIDTGDIVFIKLSDDYDDFYSAVVEHSTYYLTMSFLFKDGKVESLYRNDVFQKGDAKENAIKSITRTE